MKRYLVFILFFAIVKLMSAYTWTGTSGAYEFPNETLTGNESVTYTFTSKPNTEFCLRWNPLPSQYDGAKIYIDGRLESSYGINFHMTFSDNATHTVKVVPYNTDHRVEISRAVVKHPIENQSVVKNITLDEAGDLEYYLPASVKYYIKKLTVSGPINGKDMAIIRDMAGLEVGELSVLNMSGAQMRSGGGCCGWHFYEWSGSYGDYNDPTGTYVDDDVINDGLFFRLNNLVEVALPASVTQIRYRAFDDCNNLEKVTIGNSTTVIGNQAFSGCSSLKSISLPEGIKTIEERAFLGCFSLSTVSFPSSLTTVSDDAFDGCNSISRVSIADLASWCSVTFANIYANPTYYSKKIYIGSSNYPITSLSIPNGVTSIGSCCFANCTGITSLTFPTSLKSIGENAFRGCSGLVSLNIPEGVTQMGAYCFKACNNIQTVKFPSTLKLVREGAFDECNSIIKVSTPSIAAWCSINFDFTKVWETVIDSDGNVAIAYDSEDGDYELHNPKYYYKSNPLYYSHKLFIGDSLINILDIPEGVEYIGRGSFAHCKSITAVSIPESLTTINEMAFWDCGSISNVKINSINSWNKLVYKSESMQQIVLGEKGPTIDGCTYYDDYYYTSYVDYSSNPIYATCTNSMSDVRNIQWSSTNTTVAQVNDKGRVTAFLSGSTVILASSDDNNSFCNVTIEDPSVILGDVNGNGDVSISDVTALVDILLSGNEAPAVADINRDGNISISDVTSLIDALLNGN